MYFNRLLSGSSNNNMTATNRNRLTLSSRAGPFNPFLFPIRSSSSIISPQSSSTNNTNSPYTQILPTLTSTDSYGTTTTSTTTTQVQIVNLKPLKKTLPDHYYYLEHDSDYYDNNEEISSPTIKSSKNSSNSLSQSSLTKNSFIFPNIESELRFKLPVLTEPRYDQSTLKSFFMNSKPTATTEGISLTNLKNFFVTTEKLSSAKSVDLGLDFDIQRKKILSFIISENQPSSFKAPSTTSSSTTPSTTVKIFTNQVNNKSSTFSSNNSNKLKNSYINTQPLVQNTNIPVSMTNSTTQDLKPLLSVRNKIDLNSSKSIMLTSSENPVSHIFNKTSTILIQNQLTQKGALEKIPAIRSQNQSLYLKPIEPTTYSPLKPYRVSTSRSEISSTFGLIASHNVNKGEVIENSDSLQVHSRRRPYVNDYLSSTSKTSTKFHLQDFTTAPEIMNKGRTTSSILATSTTKKDLTSLKSIATSLTSRGHIFKQIINKTLEPQAHLKPIVSPYASLESQRLTNAIRTTTSRTSNHLMSIESTSASPSLPLTTYRNYFIITASPKNISTYLFPEMSRIESSTSQSALRTSSSILSENLEQISSTTERNRGKYRPYFVSSQVPNTIDIDTLPTTYSPRYRYNTRAYSTNDSATSSTISSEHQGVKRKVIKLKSGDEPLKKTHEMEVRSSTERSDITTYTPSKRFFIESNFIPSPTRDTSDFRPIITKLSEFIRKYSHSMDHSDAVTPSSQTSYIPSTYKNVANDIKLASVAELTEKPSLYYNKYNFNNSNLINSKYKNINESHETSTKKFRATVEMPEMKVPLESNLNVSSSSYDEEENDELPYDDDIDTIIDVSSTTSAPLIQSIISETSTTTQQTTPTLLSTESNNLELSTSTTANPKSLIPPRATRVNNQLKSSIIASGLPRRISASIKCNDASSHTKCNEISSRYTENYSNKHKEQNKKDLRSIKLKLGKLYICLAYNC